jgi:signal transduction histidine kinase
MRWRCGNLNRLSLISILRNLVENALKYGGDGLGRIQMDYRENGDHHVLSVRDLDAQKIFGLLARSTNARGAQGAGGKTGLNSEMSPKR